jgi:hypothetical protein
METRICNCCGEEKPLSEYYSNGVYRASTICKSCTSFQKRAVRYKERMDPVDYEKWFNENNPKVVVVKKKKRGKDITETYMYRNLKRFGNCYVRTIDEKTLKDLEIALNVKLRYNETRDNIGYVIEVIKC